MEERKDQCDQRPKEKTGSREFYETVLNITRTIAFTYDLLTGEQEVFPAIENYIAGNYDGRLLSNVMLEDHVIYPDDIEKALEFRDKIQQGGSGKLTLRLLTPAGIYRWFEMILTPCIRNKREIYAGVYIDVDEETRQREILRYRAEFDPVSGIYNKTTFFEKTQKLLAAEPEKLHFLVRFDVDRFKIINELYTISEGDRVLRFIGENIQKLLHSDETYARMGNDIFGMCLNRTKEETIALIEELKKRINTYPISFQFVLSAGIVEIDHYDGESVDILCDWAALAQQKVKGSYIQCYAFYEKRMTDDLNWEHEIIVWMQQALEEEQFQVYFQPKYNMQNNVIIGAEALVRWNHPKEGMISPAKFIPLFERNGFILKLDEYIWEQTCIIMRKWMEQGIQLVPISVNVSRLHLHNPRFCKKIPELCQKYQISPEFLQLEITESAYIDCPQMLYGIMEQLQEQGFVFSMDDFGSGYSSLNSLKDIPVNIVKIDLKFLQKARRGDDIGYKILRGTIRMILDMGLNLIVEGVETRDQVDFLLSAGCVYAQGYYYAKPMPKNEFEKILIESF